MCVAFLGSSARFVYWLPRHYQMNVVCFRGGWTGLNCSRVPFVGPAGIVRGRFGDLLGFFAMIESFLGLGPDPQYCLTTVACSRTGQRSFTKYPSPSEM